MLFEVLWFDCLEEETVGDMNRGGFLPRFSLVGVTLARWEVVEAVEGRLLLLLVALGISVTVPIMLRVKKRITQVPRELKMG